MHRVPPRTFCCLALLLALLGPAVQLARGDSALLKINVGTTPDVIAVNPVTNRIYVGNSGSNSISVIDGASNEVFNTINTPLPVRSMTVNPKTNRIYVICSDVALTTPALYLLNGGDDSFTPMGNAGGALSVAIDVASDEVYVGEKLTSQVRVLSGIGALINFAPVANPPVFLELNPVTRRLYLASATGDLSVVDRGSLTETPYPNLAAPYSGIVVNPATNRIYARGVNTNSIVIIDGATNATTTSTAFADTAANGLGLNPVTNTVYAVAGSSVPTLNVLDGATNDIHSVPISGAPDGLAINTLTNKIYVSDPNNHSVNVVQGDTLAVTSVFVGAGAKAIGVNPITNRVYVVNSGEDSVSVLDGSTYSVAPLPGVKNVLATAVDSGLNQFFAGTPNGALRIDGATQAVSNAGFNFTATTAMVVNARNHKLYSLQPSIPSLSTYSIVGDFGFALNLQESADQIAIDESTNRVYVAGTNPAGVVQLEVISGDAVFSEQTAVFPIGVSVLSIAVNPLNHKAYFATSGGLYRYGPDLNGDPVYIGGPGDDFPRPAGPHKVAIDTLRNRVYFAVPGDLGQPTNNFGGLRVYDSETDLPLPALGVDTAEGTEFVAVNSQAHLVYTVNSVAKTVTITDADNSPMVVPLPQTPVDIVADETYRRAFILSDQGRVFTIDGNALSSFFDAVIPGANTFSMDPVTSELLVGSFTSNASLVSGTPPGQSALATAITPLPNDGLTFSPLDSSIGLQAISLFAPYRIPVQQIYFQIDHSDQQWTPAFLNDGRYLGDLEGLSIGAHTIYAFATDSQVDGSAASSQGSSPLVGQVSAYSFEVRPGSFFFATNAVTTTDDQRSVTVTVFRDFFDASTVDYATESGTALPGVNYIDTRGTLVFQPGETSQTITVPIINREFGAPFTLFELSLNATDPRTTESGHVHVTILDDHSPDLSLSRPIAVEPSFPPVAAGSISVTLQPGAAGGQWRLFGELDWRASGSAAFGLQAGNYRIEFKTVEGFLIPSELTIPVENFQFAHEVATYTAIDPDHPPEPGGIQVNLLPGQIGGWRLQGEADFRQDGDPAVSVPPGDYIVEFEPAPGRATPPKRVVRVSPGGETDLAVTYLLLDSPTGLPSALLPDYLPRIAAPYEFIGQIQTDDGFGTGFVPLDRVVVTAAHVLFDDGTLSYVPGVRWFFQVEKNLFQGPPQIPRGTYLFEGYAAQRATDNLPGTSSNASQQLDGAAMYFLEPTARGGASGYLASNAATNPWLTSGLDKEISGYPVEQISISDVGKLHTTPSFSTPLEFVSGALFRTTAVRSFPGNSGGPLSVRLPNGQSFPAAIYLGGTAQTVVRAIDAQLVDLMTRAQISGSGGANNVGGGVTQVNNGLSGTTQFALGSLKVELRPAGAVAAGARWRLNSQTTQRISRQAALGLASGSYRVRFSDIQGYQTPADLFANVTGGGQETSAVAVYVPTSPPAITSPATALAIVGQPFRYQVTATFDATSFAADVLPAGLAINASTGVISGTPTGEGEIDISLSAANGRPGAQPRNLHITVATPGMLTISVVGQGTLPRGFLGTSIRATGSTITVKAAPRPGFVFDHWADSDSGTVLALTPTYRFTVLPRQRLEVTFVPDLFLAGKGSYAGLLQGGTFDLSGLLSLNVTRSGAFTARVSLGRATAVLKNSFNSRGHFEGPFSLSDNRLFQLRLDLGSNGVIAGTFTDLSSNGQYPCALNRGARAPRAFVGAYTARFPVALDFAIEPGVVVPGGTGFGRLLVKANGAVSFAGRLGDGSAFTAAAHLDGNGAWPFYSLAGGRQVILGGQSPLLGAAGFSGQLAWHRPANAADLGYPDGYWLQLAAEFVSFRPPALASRNVQLALFDLAGMPLPVENLTLNSHGTGSTSDAAAVRLKVVSTTGLLSGSFVDQAAVSHDFFGAILQVTQSGVGLYLNSASGLTGRLLLQQP